LIFPDGLFTYARGWKIVWNAKKGEWFYEDNGKLFDNDDRRPCKRCGRPPTKEGHDACLGTIPGVKHACCGHGVEAPTIVYEKKKE